MSKGLLKTFEVIIALFVIFSFFIIFYAPKEILPEFDTINWKLKGYGALKVLDENNELRNATLANDTRTIKNRLSSLLPSGISYELVVCQQNCTKPTISADKLVSVNYMIAGDIGNLNFREIILYMW